GLVEQGGVRDHGLGKSPGRARAGRGGRGEVLAADRDGRSLAERAERGPGGGAAAARVILRVRRPGQEVAKGAPEPAPLYDACPDPRAPSLKGRSADGLVEAFSGRRS